MSFTPNTYCWTSPSPETTAAAARALVGASAAARRDDAFVVALSGALGAGKTVFAKGLGEGFGFEADQLSSPTFTIASAYPIQGGAELVHVDLYRLDHAAELESAGLEDWLAPGNLVAIEWADRFPEALPADRLEVALEVSAAAATAGLARAQKFGEDSAPQEPGAQARRFVARALGPVAAEVLANWEQALQSIAVRD
jgi:tRNA threonylcarbamoyladenosine biosynthesis protein TsaE